MTPNEFTLAVGLSCALIGAVAGALLQRWLTPDYKKEIAELKGQLQQQTGHLSTIANPVVKWLPNARIDFGGPEDMALVLEGRGPFSIKRIALVDRNKALLTDVPLPPNTLTERLEKYRIPLRQEQNRLLNLNSDSFVRYDVPLFNAGLSAADVETGYLPIRIEHDYYRKDGDSAQYVYTRIYG